MSALGKITICDNALIWEELKSRLKKRGLKPTDKPALSLRLISAIREEFRAMHENNKVKV